MSFFGGSYKTLGPSDQQIEGLIGSQRRANRENYQTAFTDGLRGLSQGAQNRGLGQSGAVAMGVPSLQGNIARQAQADEAALMRQRLGLMGQQVKVHQPGLGQQLVPGLMGLAGSLGGALLGNPAIGGMLGGMAGQGLVSMGQQPATLPAGVDYRGLFGLMGAGG